MTGGLLQLVSFGIQDDILIGTPEITFFKCVYRKYTNFSIDTLNTIHSVQFGSKFNVNIPKTGDLLYKTYIKLDIPKIIAYYDTTLDDDIKTIKSNSIYYYSINHYNFNKAIMANLTNLLNDQINSINNNNLATEFLTYISHDGSLKKLYRLIESSNLMTFNLNINNSKLISNSNSYSDLSILQYYENHNDILAYSFNNLNLLNENNYYTNNYAYYINLFNIYIKSYYGTLYTYNNYYNTLNKLLFDMSIYSLLDSNVFNIITSYTYYNNFIQQLYINTMPNEIFRQDYNYKQNGYQYINDIMLKLNVNGNIMTYDNHLYNKPKYLVFVDKNDPNILIPIFINSITKYQPNTLYTQSNYYYNYNGYIANIDYFNRLISYTSNYPNLIKNIQFHKTIFDDVDFKYRQINITLNISNINITKSNDNTSYLYDILINTNNIQNYDPNNLKLSDLILSLISIITDLKYITYICNYTGYCEFKNIYNSNLLESSPMAILLIDNDKPPIYDDVDGFHIYCKNNAKGYDLSNLEILSPYIPIMTSDNKFFNTEYPITDYNLQLDYSITNKLDSTIVLNNIVTYPQYIENILRQFINTSSLILYNTYTSSNSLINFDINFLQETLNSYKNYLSLDNTINNYLLDNINNHFITYINDLINSYQTIAISTHNYDIIHNQYNTNLMINDLITNNNLPASFDLSSIVIVVFTNNNIVNSITYNDIVLTNINNSLNTIYKIRLYPFFNQNNTISTTALTDDQINFIIPNNQIISNYNILYNGSTYTISYIYTILQIISINSNYIDVYVSTNFKLYKNQIEFTSNEYAIFNAHNADNSNTYIFIDQQFSYIPNINNQYYPITNTVNPSIIYTMVYTDQYPNTNTGTDIIVNQLYYYSKFYLSQQMQTSRFEDISLIKLLAPIQNNNTIYDIISYTDYSYGLMNIDLMSINLSTPTLQPNIFIHDIFMNILYHSYRSIILNNNSNIANAIGYIVQDTSFLISSFFKDPNIILDNNTYTINNNGSLVQIALNNLTSYQNKTIDPNYSNNDWNYYRLFNIISNDLILSSKNIYNTSYQITERLDNNFLNYANSLLIFNESSLTNIINNILISQNEPYITSQKMISFFNNNYTSSYIIDILNILGQTIPIDVNNKPLSYPIPFVDSSNNSINVLNVSSSNNIINNLLIYSNTYDPIHYAINKQNILDILTNFKDTLSDTLNDGNDESYYDIDTIILNTITDTSGVYYNQLLYGDLFNLINQSMKTYFEIYLKRSGMLNSILISLPFASADNIITLITTQITDYTNSSAINKVLYDLKTSNIINQTIIDAINNEIFLVATPEEFYISSLPEDSGSDNYQRSYGLSYFKGLSLINTIIRNVNISKTIFNIIANNTLSPNIADLINSVTSNYLTTLVFGNLTSLNIYNIQLLLNKIVYYTIIKPETAQLIINQIKIFNFDDSITCLYNNIKLIYYSNGVLTSDSIYINDSILNIIVNNINNDTITNTNTNIFIDNLLRSKLMLKNSSLIYQIINLYNTASINNIVYKVFTENITNSIINICNNDDDSSSIITPIITKLTNIINATPSINTTFTKNSNPLRYDQFINFNNLNYYDKIFYLYHYLITKFYNNINIDISSNYDQSINYTHFTIFFNDIDNTYNINNSFVGFNLKTNFNIIKSDSKQYYNSDYYISITLNNINAIFLYFSKILNDPINYNGPFNASNLDGIFMNYYNNSNYNIIASLLQYIVKYSSTLDQNIINIINGNPITKTIYESINLYIFLLINITSNYELFKLLDESHTIFDNNIYILQNSPSTTITPHNTISLPNISNYQNDIYTNIISNNDFNNYFSGVLVYNVNNSIYNDFILLIDAQYNNYYSFYNKLYSTNIGYNSQTYIDLYNHLESFDINDRLMADNYFTTTKLDIVNNQFKSAYRLTNSINLKNSFNIFIDLSLYLKSNIATYNNQITYINFRNVNLDINSYYSDVDGFYNYIVNTIKPSSYIYTLLTNSLIYYRNRDIKKYNQFIYQLFNTQINFNILNIVYKNSLITSNLDQLVYLHNFNTYYKENSDVSIMINDFNKLLSSSYNGINSNNTFYLFTPNANLNPIVINDYVGNFFISSLMLVNNQNEANVIMQNVKVSTKIIDAVNMFFLLSQTEQFNIITIYNDLPKINAYLIYLYNNNMSINELSNYTITNQINNITTNNKYTFYDIIMTDIEYNLIFGSILRYNFNTGSIGILIYSNNLKYDINLIYNITKLDPLSSLYTFKLYRKTDLPSEYRYIYNSSKTTIIDIGLSCPMDEIFEIIYNQISIYGENFNIRHNIEQSLYYTLYAEDNNMNLSRSQAITQIDLIDYYSNINQINIVGLTYCNINNWILNNNLISDVFININNPIKYFNYLYYGSYLQPELFLTFDLNYAANLTIYLYRDGNLVNQVYSMYSVMYNLNNTKTQTIIEYIKYIDMNIGLSIQNYINSTSLIIDTSSVLKQTLTLVGDISIQYNFIITLYNLSIDYTTNLIIQSYIYNNNLPYNPINDLMNIIFNTLLNDEIYSEFYVSLMGHIMYLNIDVYNAITLFIQSNNVNKPYPSLIEAIETLEININSVDRTNPYYDDEQEMTYNSNELTIDMNNIRIDNRLLNESHKILKINDRLYMINEIQNFSQYIYINYPYNLFFVDSVSNIITLIYSRISNNQVQNDLVGTYTIYPDYNTFPNGVIVQKQFINFDTDFFVANVYINGEIYHISDLNIQPYNNDNINKPSIYIEQNITKISLLSNDYIMVNKNYINTQMIQLYINNLNELYITDHYIINDDQTVVYPKIVGLDNYYSSIMMIDDMSNIEIENIKLGLNNILTTELDQSLMIINSTEYTLYDILSRLNTNNLIISLSDTTIKTTLNNKLLSYDSKYYRNLNRISSNYDILNLMINSITVDIINDNNDKNYNLNIYNLIDNLNPYLDLLTNLNDILMNEINRYNIAEVLLLSSRNSYYDLIVEYISKPEIPTFSFIPYLVDFIIDKINMKIDGTSVDEIKDAYLYVYHNFIKDRMKQIGYNRMNMNNEKLLLESETKDSFSLYIDVPLYFSQISGLSFPMLSSLYSKMEFSLDFRKLEDLVIYNKLVKLKYKNNIKMTMIYDVIYLEDYERDLFISKRHEYLYEQKLYNSNIQLNVNNPQIFFIPFQAPIKDLFYFVQLDKILIAKQYYNFTYNYLLPELYMSTRCKLMYLQQMMDHNMYDIDINRLYNSCMDLMMTKVLKLKLKIQLLNDNSKSILSYGINLNNLSFLYNNLTEVDKRYIEKEFENYYMIKLKQKTISKSTLYLNSVKRFDYSSDITNMLIPIEYYNNMICGLNVHSFSLHPLEYQPSGSANFNSFKTRFSVGLDNIDQLTEKDVLNIHIFVHSYNIIRFMSGIVGNAW